mgnify:FL=1
MSFHDLEHGTLRAYNPRRDTAFAGSPTPEFYSDTEGLWNTLRGAAEVGALGSGLGGVAGAFTRLPTKMKKILESLARTRARNVQRPDMAPDLVNEGWESILESPRAREAQGPLLKSLWARTSPPPVEKFSEKGEEDYRKILTGVARNAMRRHLWKNIGPVEEPATLSKLKATIAKLEQRHYAQTGSTPTDAELAARLGISPREVMLHRSSPSLGQRSLPLSSITGETRLEETGVPRVVPRELRVLPEFRVERDVSDAIAKTPLQKQVLALYQEGLNNVEIGKKLGKSSGRIQYLVSQFEAKGRKALSADVPAPHAPSRITTPIQTTGPQEKAHQIKTGVTEPLELRERFRGLYEQDIKLSDIAAALGITLQRAKQLHREVQ